MSILVSASVSTVLQSPCVHFTHLFSTRDRCTHALRGSSLAMIEKCQTPQSHVHPPSVRRSWLTETIIDENRKVFESRYSVGATEKLSGWEKPHAQTVAWSYDVEGYAKKCVERYCELANRKIEQLFKVSTPCLDDLNLQKEELETVGELSKVCSEIVLKCFVLGQNW